jgi:hypothetical protein
MKRVVSFGITACVLLLAFGLTKRLLGPAPGITQENSQRVRAGMTYQEVEAIFGGPPQKATDVFPPRGMFRGNPVPQLAGKDGVALLDWAGEHGRACVVIQNGRVENVLWTGWDEEGRWTDALLPQPSLLDRVRSFLGF